jgi:hypothetical protein
MRTKGVDIMGRLLITGILLLTLAVGTFDSAQCINTWVDFANPRISHLDDNMYRFRVDVTWGGDQYTDPDLGSVVDPILDRLWINNTLGMAVSWTGNHSGSFGYSYAGDWYGGVESPSLIGEFGLHGPEFGWDFIADGPMQSSYSLGYTAFMSWLDYDYYYMQQVEGGNQLHEGNIIAMVIPEPATLLLFGFGFVGLAVMRRGR